jgi:hypothetical protein
MAFVTSSDVSKVAASESMAAPLPAAASVRVTNARAPATSLGVPGIVTEPMIAPRPAWVMVGVSICACLP